MEDIQPKKVLAKDIMNKKVISVRPDTSIFDVAKLISEHNFDGLPVIDQDGKLVGIVTEYDLITKTSAVNSSFLEQILREVKSDKFKNSLVNNAQEISSLKVSDIMNTEPLTVRDDSNFDEIIRAFVAHHRVNPIIAVDENDKVVGVISRFDILRPLNLLGYGLKK